MKIEMQSCDEIQAAAKAMMSGEFDGDDSGHHDHESLARHLDNCVACRAALDAMTANEFDWNQTASVLARGGPVGGLASDCGTSNSNFNFGTSKNSDQRHTLFISCLSPTDDPDSLGRIGSLEIRGVIGHGGAGIVYKAIDPALGRTVAVKLLNPASASDEARSRFSREARAMAAITHDNVLPVHAVSQHQELPYLVTEYVPGGTLAQRLADRGRLELIETVRVGLQIARGLSAAHRQGVVHRDVKPSNILLDPGVERVRVADFGLARAVNEHSSTESGKLMGTPQFMSPEQVQGRPASFSSDLFSLGSVLFQCCTGRPPFEGDSIYSIMQKITNEAPPSARQACDDVPEWLDHLIRRLHSRHPQDRFENADTVAEILEAELLFLQQPTLVPQPQRIWLPTSRSQHFLHPLLRNRTAMITTGMLLMVTVIAAQWNPAEPLNSPVTFSLPDENAAGTLTSPQDHEGRMALFREEFRKLNKNRNGMQLWSTSTAIAEAGDPRAIPVLIGAIEADNSYATVYGVGYYALGFGELGKLTGVKYSKFHDGAWWRRWWETNKARFPDEAQAIPIQTFPKTSDGKKYTPFPSDLDTHEGRVRFMTEQLRKAQPDFSSLAELFTEYDDPRGIPVLIGIIVADKSGNAVYDVGYFGLGHGKLGKQTGVRYDESHDADWWQAWWATHRRDFPPEANMDIPKFEVATNPVEPEAPDADVQDIPAQDIRIADDPNQRYFLIGDTSVQPPKSGFKLLVVLPGGDGGADFQPFVRRIRKYALDDDWIVAEPVAVFWSNTTPKDQQIVWPKKSDNVADAKFTTEEFVSRVITDVSSRVTIDLKNVLTLSWSSSGHAAYAIAMQPDSPVTGSYIAMSVFRAAEYDTMHARERRIVIDHSPDDRVCPYEHSVAAEKTLTAAGAEIKRLTYEGGHGWHGDLYGRLQEGIEWLSPPP
jgi:serine/threonine protein kinase/predicted esterase